MSGSDTTPLWMIAKNCGVLAERMAEILRAAGIEIIVGPDFKPAVRKADLLALVAGDRDAL
jgi:hypothetical protein